MGWELGSHLHGWVILTIDFFRVNRFVTQLFLAVTKYLKGRNTDFQGFIQFMVGPGTSVPVVGTWSIRSCSPQGARKEKKIG